MLVQIRKSEVAASAHPGAARGVSCEGPEFTKAFAALLVRERLAEPGAIGRALRASEAAGERLDLVLVKLGLISERDLSVAYAKYCHLPLIGEVPERPVAADRLKPAFLRANRLLPISIDSNSILIATTDPFNIEAAKAVSYMLDVDLKLGVITPEDLEQGLRQLYQETDESRPLEDDIVSAAALAAAGAGEFDVERLRDIANEAPVIRLVNQLIAKAVEKGASDIHIEPGRDQLAVRYRVDGFLQQERDIPPAVRAALTTRIKIMAKLDIAERRLPQDGRIQAAVRGVEIDIRVSTLPTAFGESIVLRVLDRTRVELNFGTLGLSQPVQSDLFRLMSLPNGIVLVTGPTGSGKTTTLYTALKHLNRRELKLFTVEDPIEYQLAGINQIQVQSQIGLDFPLVLRSVLRQDPDIVMIGEIRDLETARIAVQAALTGHLVFSTLHTNSAAAAITRLLDLGVERFLLSSTISGVLAQRLVRKLCDCARPASPAPALRQQFSQLSIPVVDLSNMRETIGCEACGGTGYRGRTAVSELLVIDEPMRSAIGRRHQDQRELELLARNSGFRTLYEDGLAKVAAGETTLQEVLRVTRAG